MVIPAQREAGFGLCVGKRLEALGILGGSGLGDAELFQGSGGTGWLCHSRQRLPGDVSGASWEEFAMGKNAKGC